MLCFAGSARTATCCELCFASTHTTKECAQQGDPDPGVKDRLKAIEKVVLSLAPGATGPHSHPLRGGECNSDSPEKSAGCSIVTAAPTHGAVIPTFAAAVEGNRPY